MTNEVWSELLAAGHVKKMLTNDGREGGEINAKTDGPSNTKEMWVPYVVEPGYVRYRANFYKAHSQGDSAQSDWDTDNLKDGTVYLRVRVTGFHASATAGVNDAYQIKQDSLDLVDEQTRAVS
ncbi:MAG: hypothetical protein ACKO45_14905 [Cyanobium sp.]